MNYYYCSSCNKRVELKYKKSLSKSELHMNNEGTVINKYNIMNPELCQKIDIKETRVNDYKRRLNVIKLCVNGN